MPNLVLFPDPYVDIGLAILGLIIGSFIALLRVRLPTGEPFIAKRSHCVHCKTKLGALDLVPLVSFVWLRGQCRHCGKAISPAYWQIEALSLGIALWSAALFEGPMALVTAVLGWQLLLLAILDAEHFWLPDALNLFLGLTGLLACVWLQPDQLFSRFCGVIAGYVSLRLIAFGYFMWRKRQGMGGGDSKMLAASGAWLGWIGLPSALIYAALSGLVWAMILRRRGVSIETNTALPFGVFLAIGIWLTWNFGPLGLAGR